MIDWRKIEREIRHELTCSDESSRVSSNFLEYEERWCIDNVDIPFHGKFRRI